jgi:superfamily II DNA or RNA helicase
MIKLRKYQQEAINAIKKTFEDNDRQYIEMPTGAGKTITFLSYASKNHERILIVVPSKELLNQVYNTALLFYHKDQLSRKGNGFDESPEKIHICIINSIKGKYLEFITGQYFDLVIIDEAHHVQCKSYQRLIEGMVFCPKFLGVTATPDRLDGLLMKDLLGVPSYKIEIEQLIEEKHLSDIEGFCIKTNIDLSMVDSHNGDFSLPQLYKLLATDARNGIILDICQNQMSDRKTLVFCINVQHAKEIAKSLTDIGISSKAIYGKMKEEEKRSILDSFRRGEISCLCNCQLLTEGFDEPSIDGIILARPTRSKSLFIQMIGRGLRNSPGKFNCKIIDIVDNHRNLSNFSHILEDNGINGIDEFKGIKDLRERIEKARIDSIEVKLERVNFFDRKNYLDEEEILPSMEEYLGSELKKYGNLSFDEASFLIWMIEQKKRLKNGNSRTSL